MTTRLTSILTVLSRSLRLRCPACGQLSIASSPFRIRHHCPNCHSLFKREEGFFVGAILANLLMTELVILLVCMVWLMLIGSSNESLRKSCGNEYVVQPQMRIPNRKSVTLVVRMKDSVSVNVIGVFH